MSTLRILIVDPADSQAPAEWSLFDSSGHRIDHGRGTPSVMPRADRVEAVVAASLVRTVALALPPLPGSRLPAAARYALEDRLALPPDGQCIAVGTPRSDGSVVATVVDASVLAALGQHPMRFARVIVETSLAPASATWTLYRSTAAQGFVTLPDGSAFAVTMPDDNVPDELAIAVRQAFRSDAAPARLDAAFDAPDAMLSRYSQALGAKLARTASWRWDQAAPSAFATAPDLLASTHDARPRAPLAWRGLRPALVFMSLALLLQVGATLGQWAWLQWQHWQIERDWMALARTVGIADASDTEAAAAGIRASYERKLHAAGLSAPSDALPLLARAAPAIALLPPSALRSATYAGGSWTLEIARIDPLLLDRANQALFQAGVHSLQASNATGTRVRVTP